TEQTYMLLDNDVPRANPLPSQLGSSAPRPACAPAGQTRFVFPVGISAAAADPLGPAVGYGLTSLDADFDGAFDMVSLASEATLRAETGVTLDFDGDGLVD